MGGFLGFVVTLLYLFGKISFYLLLLAFRTLVFLCRNTSQFIQSRWKDVLFCFFLSVFLAHWIKKSQDGVYLLIHVSIFAISLVFTRALLTVWKLNQRRIKVLIRYIFRKGFFIRWYVQSKEYSDR